MTSYHDRYTKLMADMGALGKAIPEPMTAFSQLHEATSADGALDGKTKELIALGIGVTIRCEGCIVCHVQDSLHHGGNPGGDPGGARCRRADGWRPVRRLRL